MADIEYRCVDCDKTRVVSEFADGTKMKCAACGGALRKPGDTAPAAPEPTTAPEETTIAPEPIPVITPAPSGGSRLKLAKQQREELEAEAEPVPEPEKGKKRKKKEEKDEEEKEFSADELLRPKLELHPKTKVKRKGTSHTILSFLAFVLIGGITGYLRYGKELSWPGSENIPLFVMQYMKYAWIAILALNLVVVLKAMSDNMFQGILCLLIPGWSVVYLLFISDNFYLRAIFFGCMVGLAQDGSAQLYDIAASGMQSVNDFINSGGGDVRRTDPSA